MHLTQDAAGYAGCETDPLIVGGLIWALELLGVKAVSVPLRIVCRCLFQDGLFAAVRAG